MDLDLMITSFPKLLNATLITLKLLSLSLFFGLFIGLIFAIFRLSNNIRDIKIRPIIINCLVSF